MPVIRAFLPKRSCPRQPVPAWLPRSIQTPHSKTPSLPTSTSPLHLFLLIPHHLALFISHFPSTVVTYCIILVFSNCHRSIMASSTTVPRDRGDSCGSWTPGDDKAYMSLDGSFETSVEKPSGISKSIQRYDIRDSGSEKWYRAIG